ncbi:hypothetical protein [Thiorhodococcus drewsii]|uniref:hypothetical protein n=1 Tax=Thiorhodococcus drewsii TaxID=210408 RepID=UPI001111E696|nr:hypothetical protein [Thiorhodococcus drewsii]
MPFLYYFITTITIFVVGFFVLLLWVAIEEIGGTSFTITLFVIASSIIYVFMFIQRKVAKHHDVQRHLSQRDYNRKMKKIKIRADSNFSSTSNSANKINMTQMANIIRSETSKRKQYITPNNLERIENKLATYIGTHDFKSAYSLHQLIINTKPNQLNQKLDNLLD